MEDTLKLIERMEGNKFGKEYEEADILTSVIDPRQGRPKSPLFIHLHEFTKSVKGNSMRLA